MVIKVADFFISPEAKGFCARDAQTIFRFFIADSRVWKKVEYFKECLHQTNITNNLRADKQVLRYLDIPDAHSSIHPGGAELGALVSPSLQHRYLTEMSALEPGSGENGAIIAEGAEADSSLPDAVFVQGAQILVGGLGLWGPAVQVLETLPGANALLGRLLRDVQLAPECQGGFGAIVHKQHRETVMALQECGGNHDLLAEKELIEFDVVQTHQSVKQSAQKRPSSRTLTAATRLFSVMKVTHSRGSVSELKLVTL